VCGDKGLPGEEEMDMEAGLTMLGTFVSWRLEELEERWRWMDEVMDSVRTLLVSRIWWNLESWAAVRLEARDSPFLLGSKLLRVLRLSRALRKSDMLSSSAAKEPELAIPPASASSPEPGWAEEERLCFPLLAWSSSPLLCPPKDGRPRRWVKLLLYRPVGLGDPVTEGTS
jgi:hypothetical protein